VGGYPRSRPGDELILIASAFLENLNRKRGCYDFDFGEGGQGFEPNHCYIFPHIKAVVRLQIHSLGPADQLTRATSLIKEDVIRNKRRNCALFRSIA
jgi:hypothetical protein